MSQRERVTIIVWPSLGRPLDLNYLEKSHDTLLLLHTYCYCDDDDVIILHHKIISSRNYYYQQLYFCSPCYYSCYSSLCVSMPA